MDRRLEGHSGRETEFKGQKVETTSTSPKLARFRLKIWAEGLWNLQKPLSRSGTMTLGWWPWNPVQKLFPREILLARLEVASPMLLVILIAYDFWSMARKVTKTVLCQVLYDYLLRCWRKNVSRKLQHYAAVLIKGLMRKADNFPNHPSSSTNPIQNLSAHHPAGPILLYGGYEKHKIFIPITELR